MVVWRLDAHAHHVQQTHFSNDCPHFAFSEALNFRFVSCCLISVPYRIRPISGNKHYYSFYPKKTKTCKNLPKII